MNWRTALRYLGQVLKVEAVFMLLPLAVAMADGEWPVVRAFSATAAGLLLIGLAVDLIPGPRRTLLVREGFVTAVLCWVALGVGGAFPYFLSGEIGPFWDCLFESVSGFTTTAASVVRDVEVLSRGLLLWRSISLWVGGMGVLVLLVAVAPLLPDGRPLPVMRAETPGPSPHKLVPRLRSSAAILYGVYLGLTALQTLLLALGGMSLFDCVVTAMATAGTGGFSTLNASIGGYGSAYIEGVVLVFMFLCGVNYHLLYLVLLRRFSQVLKNDEWRAYTGILLVSAAAVALNLAHGGVAQGLRGVRLAAFQVVSMGTTTGFTTAELADWPAFSRTVLFLLMFVGACAGSSGGGLKVSRVLLLLREGRRVLVRMIHPRSVGIVRLDGKQVDGRVLHSAITYTLAYLLTYTVSLLLLALDNPDFETTAVAAAACLNNVGAGLHIAASDWQYADFSTGAKLVLCADMLLGRLEIYPVLLLFSRRK